MKNRIAILPLVALLLTGCSSKPTLYKPAFETYGSQVNSSYFVNALETLKNRFNSQHYTGSSGIVASKTKINYIESSESSYRSVLDNSKGTVYRQYGFSVLIDPVTYRLRMNSEIKQYVEGSLLTAGISNGERYSYLKESIYGESIGGFFYLANINEREYASMSDPYNSMFADYSQSSLVDSLLSVNQQGFNENCSFYSKGSVLTFVYVDSNSSTSSLKAVYQFVFSNSLTIRIKVAQTNLEPSESETRFLYQNTFYRELILASTNEKVQRVDYSNYSVAVTETNI